MKALIVLVLGAGVGLAQVCVPSPDTKAAIDGAYKLPVAERLSALRALRDKNPDDFWMQRAYNNLIVDREERIEEYKKALEQHPGDAKYLFYRGSTLVGADTKEGIRYLEQALERDPGLAPAHSRLAYVYQTQNFKDAMKLAQHVTAYLKACPEGDLTIYRNLERMDAPELVREGAQHMRNLLASKTDADELYYYRDLWAIEFKAYPSSEQDQIRARVRADLDRLKNASLKNASLKEHPSLAVTLREGYKLVNDPDGQKWVDEQAPPSDAYNEAFRKFNEEHPYNKSNSTDRNDAFVAATADWIKKWPDNESVWFQRKYALQVAIHSTGPNPDFQEVGENMLRLAQKSRDPANLYFQIAQMYVSRKMESGHVVELIEQGLADLDHRKIDPPNDLFPTAYSPNSRASVASTRAYLLGTLCDYDQGEKKYDQLQQDLPKWREALDEQKRAGLGTSTPESNWRFLYARYWEKRAQEAARKGQSLDAFVYYQRVRDYHVDGNSSTTFLARNAETQAKFLWTRLGGSDAAWTEWAAAGSASAKPLISALPPSAVASGKVEEEGKTLPDFSIADATGKSWTLAALKGKTTLINIWATWCAPCRAELPLFQKLADRVKGRSDIVVLTINTDDNQGLIEPFMKENHYTFTVLAARDYFDKIATEFSIPRNWIIDRAGLIKSASRGFNMSAGDRWVDETLKKLETVAKE